MKAPTITKTVMRFVAAIAGLWISGAMAQAVDVPRASLEQCKNVSELANAIMEARQLGIPMSKLIRHEKSEFLERTTHKLVADAYAMPRYSSDTAAKRAIEDFENDAYRSCYAQIKPESTGAKAAEAESSSYDSRKYCHSIGQVAGGSSQIEAACLKMERQAQESLRTAARSSKAEKYCTDIGTAAGGSYQIKAACIKQENAAAATLQ